MKKGFTLIELLVVVLIIGILAAIAVPQYQKSVAKARFVQAETATKMIQEAQGVFYLANGKYAEDLDQLAVSFPKENEREFKFEQTSCSIVAQAYVMCVAFSPKISFYRYYGQGNRIQCCAYAADNYAGESLCKEKTGDTTWSSHCGESADGTPQCHCYTNF